MATPSIASGRRWAPAHRRFGASGAGAHRRPQSLPSLLALRAAGLLDLLARTLLLTALVAGSVSFALLAVGPRTGAYRTVTMLTGSMAPRYPVGAILVDRPQATASLRVGQVLTYAIPVDDHRVVSHRVVSVQRDASGAYVVRTKGDANNGADPWSARITDDRVWTVRAAVPRAGSLLLAIREPRVQSLVLYVLPALCAGWVLVGLWRRP